MPRYLSRYFTIALTAALLLGTLASPSLATADEEFSLTYFPHTDVTSHFGNDYGNGRSGGRSHQGNDIFGAKHSTVLAVADGFVTAVGENYRSGYYVRIEHKDGWESWYMHLNNDNFGTDDAAGGPDLAFAPDLEIGMYVPAGAVIAYVGDSGNAEGSSSHTHFELHHDGRVLNPHPYLAEAHERWMRFMDLKDELR